MESTGKQLDSETFLVTLRSHIRQTGDEMHLSMESNLYELGLDSMAAMNLLLELEEKYAVTFPDALLGESTFETPMALKLAIVSLM